MQTQSKKSNRSYSDFFTSGFRAMASRASRRTAPAPTTSSTSITSASPSMSASVSVSTPAPSINTTTTSSSTSRRRRPSSSFRHSISITNRHSRTTSMIGFPSFTHSHSHSRTHAYAHTDTPTPPRDRRSSIASFGSWLFDRKSSTMDNSFTFSPSPQKNSRELHRSTEITEVWITAGGPYTPRITRNSVDTDESDLFQTIDPFASSPESKSFFIDLSESPTPSPPTIHTYTHPHSHTSPKHESFLSITPSPDHSFLHLPRPRRERPTSVQTMPLPSRSRRSSYYRPPSRGNSKSDRSWTLPEEQQEVLPPPTLFVGSRRESLAEDTLWIDPTHDIDWRQFHIELLSEEGA